MKPSIFLPCIVDDTPIGAEVIVLRDTGALLRTQTRSEPWRLGNGQLVVSVYGISGGYAAERVHLLITVPDGPAALAPGGTFTKPEPAPWRPGDET